MSERLITPSQTPAPEGMSAEEWSARLDLAAAYRLGAQMGWSDLLGTHFSVRIPGTQDDYLVNPYGLFFEEITASSLIRINTRGEVTGQSEWGVNRAADVLLGLLVLVDILNMNHNAVPDIAGGKPDLSDRAVSSVESVKEIRVSGGERGGQGLGKVVVER